MSMAAENADQPITEPEIRAFVGPRADFYVTQWTSPTMGMNWPAFLFSGLWLLYRKMYALAAVLFALVLVESVIEDVVFIGILHHEGPPEFLTPVVALANAIVCGSYGSLWYSKHTNAKIRDLRTRGMTDQAYFDALARRGGTRIAATLGLFLVFFALLVAASVATELALGREL
jgi:hypothetical protein